jgi:uncharacterized cupredoxin-like copper-binding protein
MRERIFAIGIAALIPVGAIAAGSHSDGHHGHAEPAAVQQPEDGHEMGHGHHAKGHAGMHASKVGGPATVDAVSRTIRVDLLDTMRFAFDAPLDLKQGDAVRFVVTNRGQIRHEFSIGSSDEQDSHRAMMRNMPNMVHDDPNAVTVDPGQTRELIWRFDGDEPVVFACNIPGHAEAGMVATAMLKR